VAAESRDGDLNAFFPAATGMGVVNLTEPGSAFGPGYVLRYVANGVAHSTGENVSVAQSIFELDNIPAELVWGVQMTQLINNAKKLSCNCGQ
jgi:hypothetical protein